MVSMFPFINPMTLFFPQFLLPFDTLYQLYAHVLQSSMSGTVEMAINQLVFFLLALGQTLNQLWELALLLWLLNRVRNLIIVDPTY